MLADSRASGITRRCRPAAHHVAATAVDTRQPHILSALGGIKGATPCHVLAMCMRDSIEIGAAQKTIIAATSRALGGMLAAAKPLWRRRPSVGK